MIGQCPGHLANWQGQELVAGWPIARAIGADAQHEGDGSDGTYSAEDYCPASAQSGPSARKDRTSTFTVT